VLRYRAKSTHVIRSAQTSFGRIYRLDNLRGQQIPFLQSQNYAFVDLLFVRRHFNTQFIASVKIGARSRGNNGVINVKQAGAFEKHSG